MFGTVSLSTLVLSRIKLKVSRWLRALNLTTALSFDDILLQPGYVDFQREEINTGTWLTPTIYLGIPIVSAPMDRTTESEMAIALGNVGGLGFIHRNLTVQDQANEVSKAKDAGVKVGAAVGADPGYEERVQALVHAGVDVILVDSAHGNSCNVLAAITGISAKYPCLSVIAGNVADFEGATALRKKKAKAVRVGMGPGSICTTRIITGMGVPQVTAIEESVWATLNSGTLVIADGGIRYSGDMVKALALGADVVMLGQLLASAIESPGRVVLKTASQVPSRFRSISGRVSALTLEEYRERAPEKAALINTPEGDGPFYCFKEYRGMGSEGAMRDGAKVKSEGEFHGKSYKPGACLVAEGVEGEVPIKGTVAELIALWTGGIRSGMYDLGAMTIDELQRKARYHRISPASLAESHPHDIIVDNGGKSYS